jgi:glycosyltransferase involved in cell wall biosynthesis
MALVQPRDPGGLAIQIAAMLSDGAALERIGREARLTVEREFTWAKCGHETVRAYRDVLRRQRPDPG